MNSKKTKLFRQLLAATALTIAATGCSAVYYDTLENLGIEKRDILVDRVSDGRKAQQEAQEEFKSALERFQSVVSVDGGDLEKKYNKLSASYDRMEDDAKRVHERIDSIEDVAKALFREWNKELDEYSDPSLRGHSEEQLAVTQARYEDVLDAMNRAADRMNPVLSIYKDQVLFLKHNLNARAISALETERVEIEERVASLIEEMDRAIAEADAFIEEMRV